VSFLFLFLFLYQQELPIFLIRPVDELIKVGDTVSVTLHPDKDTGVPTRFTTDIQMKKWAIPARTCNIASTRNFTVRSGHHPRRMNVITYRYLPAFSLRGV